MIILPKLIGHRGLRGIAPENTLISIKESMNSGLEWSEVDVKISKDKIPFLLHDDLLNRTTSGKGYPFDYLYKDIYKLDAGSWFNNKFNNVYPPSLEEVLIYCSGNNLGLNIELKPNKGKEKENVEAIIFLINKNLLNFQHYFSSFDYLSLELLRKKKPKACLGYLVNEIKNKGSISFIEECINLKCFSIGFNLNIISKELVKKCKENALKVTVYSSKNISHNIAVQLWDIGVDSVFIDYPI